MLIKRVLLDRAKEKIYRYGRKCLSCNKSPTNTSLFRNLSIVFKCKGELIYILPNCLTRATNVILIGFDDHDDVLCDVCAYYTVTISYHRATYTNQVPGKLYGGQ